MGLRRSFRRRPSWTLVVGACLLLLVALRFALNHDARAGAHRGPLQAGDADVFAVESDGTLLVRQVGSDGLPHDLPVRLLGVVLLDQHEQAAAECLRRELMSPRVRIELDQRRIDGSRRFLAWVDHGDTLLNELVVQRGWATAENHPGDNLPLSRRLRTAEQDARDNRRGVWAD